MQTYLTPEIIEEYFSDYKNYMIFILLAFTVISSKFEIIQKCRTV